MPVQVCQSVPSNWLDIVRDLHSTVGPEWLPLFLQFVESHKAAARRQEGVVHTSTQTEGSTLTYLEETNL